MNLRHSNFRVTAQSLVDITVAERNELIQGREIALTQGNEKIWDNMLCTQNNLWLYLSPDWLINKTGNCQTDEPESCFFLPAVGVTELEVRMHSYTFVRETKIKSCSSSRTSVHVFFFLFACLGFLITLVQHQTESSVTHSNYRLVNIYIYIESLGPRIHTVQSTKRKLSQVVKGAMAICGIINGWFWAYMKNSPDKDFLETA